MKKIKNFILAIWILSNLMIGLFLSINLIGLELINAQPTGGSILINGGAATTDSVSVNLTLSATDPESNVDRMCFSNDDVSWSAWEAYSTSRLNWDLTSGDGSKIVYVQFQNGDGLNSTSYSDTITLVSPDTTPPTIIIISPAEGVTYTSKNVDLIFTVDEEVSWIGYSLDGAVNVTITKNSTLSSLSKGAHNITVYANDTAGNMASSILVNFSFQIDENAPTILISSPENIMYSLTNVDLIFTVNEETDWMGYSLDGTANLTIFTNTTLTSLIEGSHEVRVYANDTSGNMGSSIVFFSVDTIPPTITILSPSSSTYTTPDISLIFSVNEPSTAYIYNLDGGSNVSISGNSTLTGLSEGNHDLILYASDNYGNEGTSNTVSFSVQFPIVDTTPPVITIISPQQTTYSTSELALTFIINEPVSWTAYSLDGEANITITGATILSGLIDGEHTLKIFARDTSENTGVSNTVSFEIDASPPIIILSSPEETTYSTPNVFLDFAINEDTAWIGYSLDGQDNLTITAATLLSELTEGSHTIVVFATDFADNTGASSVVQFSVSIPPVDTTPPTVVVVSPTNTTYSNSTVFLDFEVDEQVSWFGYSLDGVDNVTITGDTVLSGLSEGTHTLVVFATDFADNTGASSVLQFSVSIAPVDTTPPTIVISSPENTTYEVSFVTLDIFVDEQVPWIGYSLDGVDNVTITGDTVLSGLSEGSHSIVVFATDLAGNTGASNIVQFAFSIPPVDATLPTVTVISPSHSTYSVSSIDLNFTINKETSWIGYSLDDQNNVTITGKTVLSDLSNGEHNIIIYAEDLSGNIGNSGVIIFTITTENEIDSQLWVVSVMAILAGGGFIFSIYIANDLFKSRFKYIKKNAKHVY